MDNKHLLHDTQAAAFTASLLVFSCFYPTSPLRVRLPSSFVSCHNTIASRHKGAVSRRGRVRKEV